MKKGYLFGLWLYCLLFSLTSLLITCMAAGWTQPLFALEQILANPVWRLIAELVGGILFLLGLVILAGAWKAPRESLALVRENDLGPVQITLEALENIARRVSRQVTGVREVKAKAKASPEGINILLRAYVAPGTDIPNLSGQLQNKVSLEIKEKAGVTLAEVRVLVESLAENRLVNNL